jgi:hypothetical protein
MRALGNVDIIEFDVVGYHRNCVFGLVDPLAGRMQRSNATVEGLRLLIEQFLRGKAFGNKSAGAINLLLRKLDHRLLLGEEEARLVETMLRLALLRDKALPGRLKIALIHADDDLTGHNAIAFINHDLQNTAGEFGIDIDRISFKAAIAIGEARGQMKFPDLHQLRRGPACG